MNTMKRTRHETTTAWSVNAVDAARITVLELMRLQHAFDDRLTILRQIHGGIDIVANRAADMRRLEKIFSHYPLINERSIRI